MPALVLIVAIPIGVIVERIWPSRSRRSDLLNIMFSPIALAMEILLKLGSAVVLLHLRSELDLAFLINPPWPSGSLWNEVISLLLFMFLLDIVLYSMHRMQHGSPLLWTGHRIHHDDPHVDVTTTVRLHLFDQLLRALMVGIAFGLVVRPPYLEHYALWAIPFVWTYYIHLNIPAGHGRLWWLLTSPSFHLLHHEKISHGSGCNFAAFFPLMDILGRTARTRPVVEPLNIGVSGTASTSVWSMVSQPFFDALALVRAMVRHHFPSAKE